MGACTLKSSPAPKLSTADTDLHLKRRDYEHQLIELQNKLTQIQQAYLFSGRSAVIVFEGWDAAGKGGTIRRISAALDPRSFKVWPIGPPRNYYKQRHFLLRFMERLPPAGAITAFDRSWYGRVLVERVEELTPKARWKSAYREINDFERMITDDGIRLVKLFFHITPEEQLKRLEARLRDPLKRWKLSYEDFRNRGRWDDYVEAIDEMFEKTSTPCAPWHLIPANQKKYARIAAMTHVVEPLAAGVVLAPPALDEGTLVEAQKHFEIEETLLNSLRGRTD
jgi:polyphosphate kinase 2 (PPK2 family)